MDLRAAMDILGSWNGFTGKQMDRNVSTAQIGDLVEFAYPNAGFSFWAIYDGDGHVVHFGVADENVMQKLCRSLLQQMLQSGGGGLLRKTRVRRQRIAEMKLPPGVRVKVNNSKHGLWPSPGEEARARRDALLDEELTYDLLTLNCEHFATFVRYGRAVCDQIPFMKSQGRTDASQAFERVMRHAMETDTYL